MIHRDNSKMDRKIKRVLLAIILAFTPSILGIGIANDWGVDSYMIAWTFVSISTFVLIMWVLNLTDGEPPKTRKGGK